VINNYNGITFQNNNELVDILNKVDSDLDLITELGKNSYVYYTKERSFENMVNAFTNAIHFSKKNL